VSRINVDKYWEQTARYTITRLAESAEGAEVAEADASSSK